MNRLRTWLKGRAIDAPVFFSSGSALSSGDVLERIDGLRWLRQAAANKVVAVWSHDPLDALILMMALDGAARQLLLLPANTTDERAHDFARRSGCTHWTGDAHELACCVRLVPNGLAATDIPDIEDTQWVLTTSGTTSTPKLVSHNLAALASTAKADTGKGAAYCWGLLYDPARFAGLQVVLQALRGGSALALVPETVPFEERIDFFARVGVNALSATPTLWRKLLMSGRAKYLPLKVATLGGEIADQKVLTAVQSEFPQAGVRHVYASTEAGVGFSVADGLEGFPAEWLTVPPQDVELKIIDGELLLRSTRTAITYHGGGSLRDAKGWVTTGDHVESDGTRVRFVGRLNGAINVGGDKVFPEAVESVLMAHPGVAAAVVRGKKSAISGSLVEALVVPALSLADNSALRRDLLETCRMHLPKHAVPALIRFVATIEANSSGKQDRSL
jgi:acyl-coenzyme A synthetase/AMP-(fatty) acid ligase